MTITKTTAFIYTVFIILSMAGCKDGNYIDKYNVNTDSLQTLPDNFYAFRGGRIYLEDAELKKYRIWFDINEKGNVQDIFRIEDFKNHVSTSETVIRTYAIDTSLNKRYAQRFIDLSRRYKFGHIYIDKKSKISLSYSEDVSEQYVRPLNDSVRQVYVKKEGFKFLPNGWFENLQH